MSPDPQQRLCCRHMAPDQRLAERCEAPLVDQVDLAALGAQELDQGEVAAPVMGWVVGLRRGNGRASGGRAGLAALGTQELDQS